MIQEETKQKLGQQSRLRQIEEKNESLQDQLEEEEDARRNAESKVNHLNTQVRLIWLRGGSRMGCKMNSVRLLMGGGKSFFWIIVEYFHDVMYITEFR